MFTMEHNCSTLSLLTYPMWLATPNSTKLTYSQYLTNKTKKFAQFSNMSGKWPNVEHLSLNYLTNLVIPPGQYRIRLPQHYIF